MCEENNEVQFNFSLIALFKDCDICNTRRDKGDKCKTEGEDKGGEGGGEEAGKNYWRVWSEKVAIPRNWNLLFL